MAEWLEAQVQHSAGIIDAWQSAKCSECGRYHTTPYTYYFDWYSFCPNCGADMRAEQDKDERRKVHDNE